MRKCDILINIENNGLNQIPSKVIDYKISTSLILNISAENKCKINHNFKNEQNQIYKSLKNIINNNKYKQKLKYDMSSKLAKYSKILGL